MRQRADRRWFDRTTKARKLPADEEIKLAKLAKKGDFVARNLLIEAHLPYINSVAKRYSKGEPLEDRIQEAVLGFIRAIKEFNPKQGTRLTTYSRNWIRQYVVRLTYDMGRCVRLPKWVWILAAKVKYLQVTIGPDLSHEQLAVHLDLPLETVVATALLDVYIYDQPRAYPNDEGEPPGNELEQWEVIDLLHQGIKKLTPQEREVIQRHFGLHGYPQQSLRVIGEKLRPPKTHQQAFIIEQVAKAKLKDWLIESI